MQKAKQVALHVSPWSLYTEERDIPTHVSSDLCQRLRSVAGEVWEVVNLLIQRFISERFDVCHVEFLRSLREESNSVFRSQSFF
jgi:hypothetical protein